MSNAIDAIKAAVDEYYAMKAVINEKVKANLAKAFVDFFDQNPLIKVINNFAFALLIGVLVGTYSSVFVASSFLLDISKFRQSAI